MAEKNLYEVLWSGRCFVMAASEAEACSIAEDEAGDTQGVGLQSYAFRAYSAPDDWADSVPYGSDDEQTVAQILATPKCVNCDKPPVDGEERCEECEAIAYQEHLEEKRLEGL